MDDQFSDIIIRTATSAYNEYFDRLLIFNGDADESIKGSVRIHDNFILHLNEQDKVVKIEIKNISTLLDDMSIDSNILKNMEGATFSIKETSDGYVLLFDFIVNKEIIKVPFAVITEERPIYV